MRHIFLADYRNDQFDEYSAVLQQGMLDGACGIYSLLMCLHLCALKDFKPELDEVDKRSRHGKLVKEIEKLRGLVTEGLFLDEVLEILKKSYARKIHYESSSASGKKLRDFTIRHLRRGHPVLLGIRGAGLNHWVTACGLEYFTSAAGSLPGQETRPERIFLLEPGSAPLNSCLWNACLLVGEEQTKYSGGRYRYKLVRAHDEMNVGLDEGIAIWPREIS